jgi:hypothetical protein
MKDRQPPDTGPATTDWPEMTKLRRACENAELAALRELMKDFPEKMRGTLKAVLAETGATREDLRDLLLKFDPKN